MTTSVRLEQFRSIAQELVVRLISIVSAVVQQRVNAFHQAADITLITCPAYSYLFGLIGKLGRHMQSYHENRKFRRTSPDFLGCVQSVHFRHLEIEDDDVGGRLLNFIDGFAAIGGFAADLPGILLFEQIAQATPHEGAIVCDENSNGR